MVQALPTFAYGVVLLLLWPIGSMASEPYPSLGKLVDALAHELGWPVAATTEENILQLRAEKVLPASLTASHPATPTVVIAVLQGLLQWSRTGGKDAGEVVSALLRAAAASQAPIPTLPPEYSFFPPVVVTPPAVPEASEVLQSPVVSVIPCLPPGCAPRRVHRKDQHDIPRQAPLREFPHTIFGPGESPAERGAGIFPRQ